MTDPYNSYLSHVPSAASPATVLPQVKAEIDPIGRLNVSASWKRRFRLIEKAGGPDLPHFRELAFGERFGLNFNILAFIFGPIYYLIKGLWRQAFLYFICAVACIFLLEATGLGKLSRSIGYGFGAVYALRANISYYKRVVLGETPWL